MTFTRPKDEYEKDSNFDRQIFIARYELRCKLIMGAAAGLLFLTGTDLILTWVKIITVIVVFIIVLFGYTALLEFHDSSSNIDSKIKKSPIEGGEQTNELWPVKANRKYIGAAFTTAGLAIILVVCMIIKGVRSLIKNEKTIVEKVQRIRVDSLITFSVGPFTEGFDSLQVDSMIYKLVELKTKLTSPKRKFTELYIYGGVDKRPLKGESKDIFGDNVTLAQSRAEWIKYQIGKFNCLSTSCFLFTGVGGAKKYAQNYKKEDYEISRYVTINCRFVDSVIANRNRNQASHGN